MTYNQCPHNHIAEYCPHCWQNKYLQLLNAIREHHSQKADDRCIFDDQQLYLAAGLTSHDPHVGNQEEMLSNCNRFIKNRTLPGKWPSYRDLEQRILELEKVVEWHERIG